MRLLSLNAASFTLIQANHRVLRKAGFTEAPDRGKGSHRAFVKKESAGKIRLTIVPHGKEIPRGTLLAILDQAGLSREEFLKLL